MENVSRVSIEVQRHAGSLMNTRGVIENIPPVSIQRYQKHGGGGREIAIETKVRRANFCCNFQFSQTSTRVSIRQRFEQYRIHFKVKSVLQLECCIISIFQSKFTLGICGQIYYDSTEFIIEIYILCIDASVLLENSFLDIFSISSLVKISLILIESI